MMMVWAFSKMMIQAWHSMMKLTHCSIQAKITEPPLRIMVSSTVYEFKTWMRTCMTTWEMKSMRLNKRPYKPARIHISNSKGARKLLLVSKVLTFKI